MAAEDMALALMMLTDESVHSEVSRWDFERFEAFELSDEERGLLVRATRGVTTIDEESPVALRPGDESVELSGEGGPGKGFYYWPPGTAEAIKYVQTNVSDPRLQASLIAWQETRGDRFP
jgi:hypothetical protein